MFLSHVKQVSLSLVNGHNRVFTSTHNKFFSLACDVGLFALGWDLANGVAAAQDAPNLANVALDSAQCRHALSQSPLVLSVLLGSLMLHVNELLNALLLSGFS